jgi:hypothetical protein
VSVVAPIERALFEPRQRDPVAVFAVLDLAREPAIRRILDRNPGSWCCIENARLSPAVRSVAPYLLRLRRGGQELRSVLELGWGRSWGIFAVAPGDIALESVRRHFHGLLRVQDEEQRRYVFRLYDPRVARTFLPTCDAGQLVQVFGPLWKICFESEDSRTLCCFSLQRGALVEHAASLDDAALELEAEARA